MPRTSQSTSTSAPALRVILAALIAFGAVSGSGCGPSLRVVHESTVYFERCHAAELHDEVPLEIKSECWERWLRWYSSTQTGTRVLYARERLVYLAQGELVDPLATGESAAAEVAAEPAETRGGNGDPPTPPPSAASTSGLATDSSDSGSSTASPPGSDPTSSRARRGSDLPINPRRSGHSVCAPVCRPRWEACVSVCDRDDRSCVGACQTEYGACMDGCI